MMSSQKPFFAKRLFSNTLLLLAVFAFVVQVSQPSYTQTSQTARRGPINPNFLNYLNKKTKAAGISTTMDGHYLGLIPSPHLIPRVALRPVCSQTYESLPASYDLRAQGRLTPVRDQGSCSCCWAFATYGGLESYLMPAEPADYSENDLIQNSGYSIGACYGGNLEMAMAYLARWQGPINEEDNPYPYNNETPYALPSATATVRKHVQNAIFLPVPKTAGEDPVLKEAVMTYGAIYIGMRWCSGAYNETHHSYYHDDSYPVEGGHIVCVVGWDDDYPASNFNKTAPGNGAYIVRNSWGTSWGENGYFYISYYEVGFGTVYTFGPVLPESTDNYTSVYQYDPLGWVTDWGYKDATAWGANIFTATDSVPVTAVSFYAETAGTSYEIYVYEGVAAGKPRSGNLQCSTSGTTKYAGYYTIDLPASVPLSSGQKFSVVVKFTTPGYGWPIPIEECYPGYTDSATASPGQSFIDHYGTLGTSWQDVSADSTHKANICIKAFTGPKTPTIKITSPALTDSWYKGGVYSILWTKDEALAANVAIQLMHGTTIVKTIANFTPNDGSYGWKIPRGVTPRSDYFVRVKTMDGQTGGDSALFSIVAPYLTVTSPASGDSWYRGEIKMIMWSGTGTTTPKVTVQLMHGSTVAKTIALGAPNSGSYSWKIQNGIAPRTDYFIKIKTNDGYAVGNSAQFAIRAPSITIASPTTGSVLTRDTNWTITWTKAGTQNASVKIQLFKGIAMVRDVATGAPNSGAYDWLIPVSLLVGLNYKIKITTLDNVVTAVSPAFVIN